MLLLLIFRFQSVGNRVGVVEPFLMRMAHGATVRTLNRPQDVKKNLRGEYDSRHGSTSMKMLSDEQMLRVCKRFFVALILSKLVQVAPLHCFFFVSCILSLLKLLSLVHIYVNP